VVSRYAGNYDQCPHCGYFSTGLTYEDVFLMYWKGDDDSSQWRYKKRNTILGRWHQIKKEMWAAHLRQCKEIARYEKEMRERGYPPEWDEGFSMGEEIL
jgi:hypothetical protein